MGESIPFHARKDIAVPDSLVAASATLRPLPTPGTTAAPSSTPSRKPRRHYRDREACGRYIRLLSQSRQYQLRIHCPALAALRGDCYGGVHAGLFATLRDAHRARDLFLRTVQGDTPLAIWRAVRLLQDKGIIPVGNRGAILPLWVRREGTTFVAECVHAGKTHRTEPMSTPEAAHAALWESLTGVAV